MVEAEMLKKVARGGTITLIGLLLSALLGFLLRTVIGRWYGPNDYGVYSLAMTVFNVALAISMLGFPIGLQREVAYLRKKKPELVETLVFTAVVIVTISSIAMMACLELKRDTIPSIIGGGTLLAETLGVLLMALPATAVVNTLVAITQGFHRVREYVLYERVLPPALFLMVVISATTLIGRSLLDLMKGYAALQLSMLLLITYDLRKKGILPKQPSFSHKLAGSLLRFSTPLFFSNIVWLVMTWTDTLMLGHYLGSKATGIYNAAVPVARFLTVFMVAFTTIYNPLATSLYAEGKIEELKEFYESITKWVLIMTFPLFVMLFAFPQEIIVTFFGESYREAGTVLMILSAGFISQVIAGPTGLTLTAMGKTTQVLIGNTLGAIFNVILNATLIPTYGISGAAVATGTSFAVANLYKLGVSALEKIHPFNGEYLKALATLALGTLIAVYLPHGRLMNAIAGTLIASGISYIILIGSSNLSPEDRELVKELISKMKQQ
ncbi:flippase [Thermococcus sp. 9N3]|uniref:flippase n=1 Tax=Thermococcus sp. 9N3 TaxID=163002 RepID=UPI00143048C6|nr:flippase [Thermococcus sp. 9N3]NJE49560.1 flippase [Thermococcus sp. 9N3]